MPDRDLEDRAAAAVCWALGDARAIRRDDASTASMRDFDLVFEDGQIEPLEVTVFADRVIVQTSERLSRSDKAAPSLMRVWTVDAPSFELDGNGNKIALDVRRFLQRAELAICSLEAGGITRYDLGVARDSRPDVAAAFRTLLGLGSQFGFSRDPVADEDPRIEIGAGVGGVVHADLIAHAAEVEAAKPDNQRKLSASPDAPRKHLVVVVDGSTGLTLSAGHNRLIGRLPVLPPPITTVWVAASGALYVATPPGPWQLYEPPMDVFDTPQKWIVDA